MENFKRLTFIAQGSKRQQVVVVVGVFWGFFVGVFLLFFLMSPRKNKRNRSVLAHHKH